MEYQLIVPMSGKGSRFLAAGYEELKPFISVAGKPIISHILDMYPNRATTIFVVNESDPRLHEHNQILMELSPDARIVQIADNRLGPSYAALEARSEIDLDLPIIVNYADFAGIFSEHDFVDSLENFDANILTYTGFHPHMLRNSKYAYVKKSDSLVTNIQEKQPFTDSPMEEEASAGAYAFRSGAILVKAIEEQISRQLDLNGEFYTSLTIQPVIDWGYKVGTTPMEKFYQWGTPEDLEDWNSWNTFIRNLDAPQLSITSVAPHDSIILAGGKGTRLAHIANTPKALYPVRNKQLWEYSIVSSEGIRNKLLIRNEYIDKVSNPLHVEVASLEIETKGQAETASIALRSSMAQDGGITFLSCDNLVLDAELAMDTLKKDKLYLWTAKNYLNAKLQPSQFSWVEVDENGHVIKYMPKQTPVGNHIRTVIGNFTFSTKQFALRSLEFCLSEENYINGEPYLDSAIQFALDNDYEIEAIDVKLFKALGNALELKTFNYWNECWERGLPAWA